MWGLTGVWTLCAQHTARLKVVRSRVICVAFSRVGRALSIHFGARLAAARTDQSIDRSMDGAGRTDRIHEMIMDQSIE